MNPLTRLKVATPQGASGLLFQQPSADYLFRYYHDEDPRVAISLLMPVRLADYGSRELHPIFQMNLPEGFLLQQLKYRLAKTTQLDPMMLLALTGGETSIGRLSVRSDEVEHYFAQRDAPGERLEEILAWDGASDLFSELVDRYIARTGISGVQPKVLVPEQIELPVSGKATAIASDLIVKTGSHEFPGLAINEFLCMSMAKEAGIPVPDFHLSANGELFVMRRFDRSADQSALGFEDMAALMGLNAEQKYSKSYNHIAKAVRLFCATEHVQRSLLELFDSVALSCIVGNGDAHLKNFGILYSTPQARDGRLAPAFDIVNTTGYIPEDALALELNGSKSLFASRLHILEFAKVCDVHEPRQRVENLLGAVERVLAQHEDLAQRVPPTAQAIRKSASQFAATFT